MSALYDEYRARDLVFAMVAFEDIRERYLPLVSGELFEAGIARHAYVAMMKRWADGLSIDPLVIADLVDAELNAPLHRDERAAMAIPHRTLDFDGIIRELTDRVRRKDMHAMSQTLTKALKDGDDYLPLLEALQASAYVEEMPDKLTAPVYRTDWLWEDYVPLGGVTMVSGEGGTAKSALLNTIGALVTQGHQLPGGKPDPEPAGVLVFSKEQSFEQTNDTFRGRGADPKLYEIYRRYWPGTNIKISFPDHIGRLRSIIRERNVKLVILDPLLEYWPTKKDMADARSVRDALDHFEELAEECGVAIVAVQHFTKPNAGHTTVHRMLGSSAFKDKCRAVLLTVRHPDGENLPDHSLVVPAKFNLIPTDTPGIEYTTEAVTVLDPVTGSPVTSDARAASGVRVSDMSYETISNPETDPASAGVKGQAQEFLREELADGAKPMEELKATFKAGYGGGYDSLNNARKDSGFLTKRGPDGRYYWFRPDTPPDWYQQPTLADAVPTDLSYYDEAMMVDDAAEQ